MRPDLQAPCTLQFTQKSGAFSLTTGDIEFSRPRYYNKPCRNLDVSDIEGARPREKRNPGPRSTDPLEPEYLLPSFKPNSYRIPKFLRDPISVEDIKGAAPCLSIQDTMKTRDHIDYSDIPQSKGGWRLRKLATRTKQQRCLDVGDINGDFLGLHRFKSTMPGATRRETNPLEPRYHFGKGSQRAMQQLLNYNEKDNEIREEYDRSGKEIVYGRCKRGQRSEAGELELGYIHGSKPQKLFVDLHKPKDRTLRTQDIAGATVTRDPYRRMRPVKNPACVLDIPGAQKNTLQYFVTKRQGKTNPLNPRYTLLDTPREKRMARSRSQASAAKPTLSKTLPARNSKPNVNLNKMRASETLKTDINAVRDL